LAILVEQASRSYKEEPMGTDPNTSRERRRHDRYKVDVEVFLTFRPHFAKIGRIIDISRGGAAFEYTVIDEYRQEKHVEVDIFSAAKALHLARIPCKVVYDFPLDAYPTFNNIVARRCGLQFHALSNKQLNQLASVFTEFSDEATT
jgi:hypothetical protein